MNILQASDFVCIIHRQGYAEMREQFQSRGAINFANGANFVHFRLLGFTRRLRNETKCHFSV